MRRINCFNDLREYGIMLLTGEACGLSYRLLCDLTQDGAEIVQEAYGLSASAFREAWNSGSADDPHVGCIMLPQDALPFVGVFAMLSVGCVEVWLSRDGELYGIEADDAEEDVARWRQYRSNIARIFKPVGTAIGGTRNVHQMSGRSA